MVIVELTIDGTLGSVRRSWLDAMSSLVSGGKENAKSESNHDDDRLQAIAIRSLCLASRCCCRLLLYCRGRPAASKSDSGPPRHCGLQGAQRALVTKITFLRLASSRSQLGGVSPYGDSITSHLPADRRRDLHACHITLILAGGVLDALAFVDGGEGRRASVRQD